MSLKRTIALPLAGLALIAGGLTIGAVLPTQPAGGVGTPTPEITATLPGGPECLTARNRICDTMPEPMERSAWRVWDAMGGAAQLLVNPHARVELIGYTTTDPYAPGTPAKLAANWVALADSGVWYVYESEVI